MKKTQTTTTRPSAKKISGSEQSHPAPQTQLTSNTKATTGKHQNVRSSICLVKIVQGKLKIYPQMEIDHEIAKCLDTLDRQGLKYLRETLKNSNVFDEEIKEAIALVDQSKEKKKARDRSPEKVKKHDQIQEEIMEEYDTFMDDQEEPSKEKTKLGPNPTHPLKLQKMVPLKLEKFQDKIQQPLKPFAIRTSSKQGHRPVSEDEEGKKPSKKAERQEGIQTQDKKQIDQIVERINNLPQQKLKKIGKFIQILEKSQRLEEEQYLGLKQTRPYLLKPDEAGELNPSVMRSSTHKGKKTEKATSLYNPIIKGSKKGSPLQEKDGGQDYEYQEHENDLTEQNEISEQIPDVEEDVPVNLPKTMDIPDQMINKQSQDKKEEAIKNQDFQEKEEKKNDSNMGKRTQSSLIKKGSFLKNLPVTNTKRPLDIEVTESHQVDTIELNQGLSNSKMVRLGKKKLGTNRVRIVLLRNRGHPTIIGLTCIQFYNTNGKQIQIGIENLKSQSPKLLKLFNGIHSTTNEEQMFTTVFKRDYQIDLEVPQKIGGMKVWNFNKSEIQSSKETDWIELYINDRLCWEGLINKGSYNQLIDYSTDAVIEEGFSFALTTKSSQNEIKIKQQSEPVSSSEKIRNQVDQGKIKEMKEGKKVDWLEKTLMQEKIKKIMEQDKEKQLKEIKKGNSKNNRFSQLYLEQEKVIQKQKQINQEKEELKQKNLLNQKKSDKMNFTEGERSGRAISQKIDQQKDIFSSFGQSLLREKIKATEINAKVNEINQKVDKLKQTFRKDEELGYSSLINSDKMMVENLIHGQQLEKIDQKKTEQKKSYSKQSMNDFMNDSIFQEPSLKNDKKIQQNKPYSNTIQQKQPKMEKNNGKRHVQQKEQTNNKVNIDDFINQLNDLVGKGSKQNRYQFGSEKEKKITIPELPKGSRLEINLLSNWGDQQFIGINKIEFFDGQGQRVFPAEVKCNVCNTATISVFSKGSGYETDLGVQWKWHKKDIIKFELVFSRKVELSLIRFWNYIGDRVHSMIGIRKIELSLDSSLIFMGDIKKNAGASCDQIFKSCENILFTNNILVQKKILQNDWLAQEFRALKQQTVIFKKTLQNFMRPQTNSNLGEDKLKLVENKQGFKLPKRNCFEYDPPTLPSGYHLKFILHTTWGDRDFVGLNGIMVFDQKGIQIKNIKKISQFPGPLVSLAGYENDKRILNNLFDGKNLTCNDQSIWLAPKLQDIDKMEKQGQNSILIEFEKLFTLSAINIYNYLKTPKRGVRQIEIHVDNFLVYRGYLRMANVETGEIMTTINFTKEAFILEKVNYSGYNEDNMGQEVTFINQGKAQKPMF